MPVKFIAIYQDPWVNNTNEFVLIIGWSSWVNPSGNVGTFSNYSIRILDPESNVMAEDTYSQNLVEATTATAYPYSFSPAFSKVARQIILIPPGWSINGHIHAIGLQGTLEELKGYF